MNTLNRSLNILEYTAVVCALSATTYSEISEEEMPAMSWRFGICTRRGTGDSRNVLLTVTTEQAHGLLDTLVALANFSHRRQASAVV